MKRYQAILLSMLSFAVTAVALDYRGTWIKHHTSQEGGQYRGDEEWKLEVTFNQDGTFVWKSARPMIAYGASTSNKAALVDDSLTGRYFIHGQLITYLFDKPSPDALKSLPAFFAFWPNELKGQHAFRFYQEEDTRRWFFILKNEGQKTWVWLVRKETNTVEQTAAPLPRDPQTGHSEGER